MRLALPALALAAAGVVLGAWSPPQPIGDCNAPRLGATASGEVVLAERCEEESDGVILRVRRPGGPFGRAQIRASIEDVVGFGVGVGGDAVVAGHASEGNRVMVSLRAPSGRFAAPTPIAGARERTFPDAVTVAVDARGGMALAGAVRGVPVVYRRRPHGRFGRPRTLGSARAAGVRLAGDARGDLLVAWVRRGEVVGRFALAGRRFGPVRALSAPAELPDHAADSLAVGMADDGTTIVAWSGRDGLVPVVRGEDGRVERLPPLGPASAAPSAPALAVNRGGTALLAWTEYGGAASPRVRFAVRPPQGSFAVADVPGAGSPGVSPPTVALDATGHDLVLWTAPCAPGQSPPCDPYLRVAAGTIVGGLAAPAVLAAAHPDEWTASIAGGEAIVVWATSTDQGDFADYSTEQAREP